MYWHAKSSIIVYISDEQMHKYTSFDYVNLYEYNEFSGYYIYV